MLSDLGVKYRFNELNCYKEFTGLKSTNPPLCFKECSFDYLYEHNMSQNRLQHFLDIIAIENSYNPVKDMLAETIWDGEDRISVLITDILGNRSERDAKYIKKWLHQCIALAFNDDGSRSAAGVLFLEGNGGTVNMDFFAKLTKKLTQRENLQQKQNAQQNAQDEENAQDDLQDDLWQDDDLRLEGLGVEGALLSMKDEAQRVFMTSYWISYIGYTESWPDKFNFFKASSDTFRMAYAKVDTIRPRRTSFCSSGRKFPFFKASKNDPVFSMIWVIDGSRINAEKVYGLMTTDWVKQMWKQVYRELYLPNPEGYMD